MIKNNKLYQLDKSNNTIPRIWRSKGTKKKCPSLLIKCGCCNNQVRIYYAPLGDLLEDLIEINGVSATKEQWREILEEVGIL